MQEDTSVSICSGAAYNGAYCRIFLSELMRKFMQIVWLREIGVICGITSRVCRSWIHQEGVREEVDEAEASAEGYANVLLRTP